MKTTIDLDEDRLESVMALTGIATRREAIDFALREAEKIAKFKKLLNEPFYIDGISDDVVDPTYDLMGLREKEKPKDGHLNR